jgi:hypothetical protein
MEHSNLIVEPNVTQKKIKKIDWAFYDNNIFELLEDYPKSILLCNNI